jgi:predicted Zn-dependent peptidase
MIDRLSPRAHGSYVAHRAGGHYELRGEFEPSEAAAELVRLRDVISTLGDGSDASKQLFAVARRAVTAKDAAGPISSLEWSAELVRTAELGHDLAWRQALAQRAAKVTYDDVKRILEAELRPANATWMLLGPAKILPDLFARLGLAVESRP